MSLIMAAHRWPTNAHLIADCARLGYLREEWRTLDPTYGRGTWWNEWQPVELVAHDIAIDGVDFRALPHADGEFEAAVFDPPYMAPGGRKTSTAHDFNDRFGLHTTPATPALNQAVNNAGLVEVGRVVQVGGFVLTKCMDYVNGGRVFWGTHLTLSHALNNGFELVDRMEHVRHPGPQSQTTQEHARRNLSTLLVLRKVRHTTAAMFEVTA